MIISKRGVSQTIFLLLVIIMASDIALLVYVWNGTQPSKLSEWLFRDPADTTSNCPPSGYSATGERVATPARAKHGWVIRYATPRCEHCRSDEVRWSSLKAHLIKYGYQIYAIPPSATESYPANAPELADEAQISFVEPEWMKRYLFLATPTTVLFNSHGKVIWSHVGEMNQAELKSALQAAVVNR